MKKQILQFAAIAAVALASSSSHALCLIGYFGTVSDAVTSTGNQYRYDYSVSGAKQLSCVVPGAVTSYSVPYFADAGISGITSPTGWTYAINATDSFGLGQGAQTLTWTAGAGYGIASQVILSSTFDPVTQTILYVYSPQVVLGGFGYTAAFAPVKGPYGVVGTNFSATGDPALPGSPSAMAAGLTSSLPLAVPEPATALSMLAGLAAIAGLRRLRTNSTRQG